MKLDRTKVLSEMKKNCLTQKELAEKCNYSVSTINRMLQGKLLSINEAEKVAEALNMNVDDITFEEEQKSSIGTAVAIGAGTAVAIGAGIAAAAIIGALIVNAKKDGSLSDHDKEELIDLLKK